MPDDNGLPKIEGLDQVAADIIGNNPPQQQQAQQVQQPDAQVPPEEPQGDDLNWEQFKNPKELLKSYKEIQGFTTRVSQENKELKDKLAAIEERMQFTGHPQQAATQQTKPFDQMFIENPQAAIEQVATVKAFQIANTQRISEILEEEEMKAPAEFQERVGFVKMLAQSPQYANYANSPKGVRLLFQKADDVRKERTRARAEESLKLLFGDNVDMERVRQFFTNGQSQQTNNTTQTNSNAYMPFSTGTNRTGADSDSRTDALRVAKEEALKKGDVGAVAGALLREALLK